MCGVVVMGARSVSLIGVSAGGRCIIHVVPSVDVDVSDFQPGDQDAVRSLIVLGLGEHWGHVDESLNPDLVDIASTYRHGRTVVVRRAGAIIAISR